LLEHGLELALRVGAASLLQEGAGEAEAHVGVVGVDLETLAKESLGAVEIAAREPGDLVVDGAPRAYAGAKDGSSSSAVCIASLTAGKRKSERSTPLVCPQRPALVPYQNRAAALLGASSMARWAA